MPMNRNNYPDNWEEISAGIRYDRAGNRCECLGECGNNHAEEETPHASASDVLYLEYLEEAEGVSSPPERCLALNGWSHPVTGSSVVLTVAHLDHDSMNSDPDNLRAYCQRCHLAYDAEEHQKNAAETRRRRQIEAGQLSLL